MDRPVRPHCSHARNPNPRGQKEKARRHHSSSICSDLSRFPSAFACHGHSTEGVERSYQGVNGKEFKGRESITSTLKFVPVPLLSKAWMKARGWRTRSTAACPIIFTTLRNRRRGLCMLGGFPADRHAVRQNRSLIDWPWSSS